MDDITVIENYSNPEQQPVFSAIFGHSRHPDFSQPTFMRHNNLPVNIIDLYHGETCYLIGRGPSIGKFLENEETRKLLMNPFIIRYTMNSSPEVIDYNCQLWSGVDRLTKFPSKIFRNPNILKMVPFNRFYQRGYSITKGKEQQDTIAYGNFYAAHCSNLIGVHSYLLKDETKGKISFGRSFLTSPSVLYGYYKTFKSVMLFAMKIAIMLGFRKIVLIGVDFKMDNITPYYKQGMENYTKFHLDHNYNLFQWLSLTIKEIFDLLTLKTNGYNVQILTAHPITLMPFIPVIDLKQTLKEEIALKATV